MFGKKGNGGFYSGLKDKINQYSDTSGASEWLSNHVERVQRLFENYTLRDFIFEPFKGVFQSSSEKLDDDTYSVITQVAIINAVLAGLPGRMGVGVYIVMALEGWMAFKIARNVGVNIQSPKDIWKYFGVLAASVGVIFYLFRTLLGFGISLASFVPGINPLILAELFITDLVGILFIIGFKEVKETGSFSIPTRMVRGAYTSSKALFTHQYNLLKNVLSPKNIKFVGIRISEYLSGDFPVDARQINGEGFATIAMAYLLSGQTEKLDGPLGSAFLDAIRLRWSVQLGPDASQEQIANLFREYDAFQIEGAINTIKGKMFEIMVTQAENSNGDQWTAEMHTDESFPGSDIIFTNEVTGEQLEVSLKAVSVSRPEIIESALESYPDLPIMTTDEMAELYENDPRIFGSDISLEELNNITEENMDKLLGLIEARSPQEVVIGGVIVGMAAALWPFVIAYMRGKISKERLNQVFEHVMGSAGVSLASRLSWATLLGPVFAWYLLARGVKGLVVMAEPSKSTLIGYRLTSENSK